MKRYQKLMATAGVLAAAFLAAAPSTFAACGSPTKPAKPTAWHEQSGSAHILLTGAGDPAGPSIVGMWHVLFTANKSNDSTIPDTVIDNALVVWHSDNTEVMNSVRPPQDGDFCLGIWEQTGPLQYRLNHFAWFANAFPNNTNNGIGEPVGPTRFVEYVTLAQDGAHFTGSFELYAHDTSGNQTQKFTGTITGTRVTMKTGTADLL